MTASQGPPRPDVGLTRSTLPTGEVPGAGEASGGEAGRDIARPRATSGSLPRRERRHHPFQRLLAELACHSSAREAVGNGGRSSCRRSKRCGGRPPQRLGCSCCKSRACAVATLLATLFNAFQLICVPPAYAQDDASVAAKSAAIAEQIEAARRRIAGSTERAPITTPEVAAQDRPIRERTILEAGPDARSVARFRDSGTVGGLRLALAIALNRPPSETELRIFLDLHDDLPTDAAAAWGAFPARWEALTDPVERVAGYERHGARAYCALADVLPPPALREAFATDPVVAARCRDGGFILRASGLTAALDDIAFAAELTEMEGLAQADVASLGSQLAEYFSGDGKASAVENWSQATSRHVRFRLQWAALGRTEAGRRRQGVIIAQTRASSEAPVQRADVLRSRTWREYAKADLGRFMAGLNQTGRDELRGSLALNCVLSGAATCY